VTGVAPSRSAAATAARPAIIVLDPAATAMTTRVDAARGASKSCW
jgi:hypothetical protein